MSTGAMRSGYIKYKCKLCGEIYIEDFCEDVIDRYWIRHDCRNSDVPTLHACSKNQTGSAEMIGYIVCEEGKS